MAPSDLLLTSDGACVMLLIFLTCKLVRIKVIYSPEVHPIDNEEHSS